MKKKQNKTSAASEVQVFELTMDNPEDQDELVCSIYSPNSICENLNRRLRKPGEPALCAPAKLEGTGNLPPAGVPSESANR